MARVETTMHLDASITLTELQLHWRELGWLRHTSVQSFNLKWTVSPWTDWSSISRNIDLSQSPPDFILNGCTHCGFPECFHASSLYQLIREDAVQSWLCSVTGGPYRCRLDEQRPRISVLPSVGKGDHETMRITLNAATQDYVLQQYWIYQA